MIIKFVWITTFPKTITFQQHHQAFNLHKCINGLRGSAGPLIKSKATHFKDIQYIIQIYCLCSFFFFFFLTGDNVVPVLKFAN